MSALATVTGHTGPGGSVTALVLNPVHSIEFNFEDNMVYVEYGTPSKRFPMSYQGVGTVTFSISGGVTTITVS